MIYKKFLFYQFCLIIIFLTKTSFAEDNIIKSRLENLINSSQLIKNIKDIKSSINDVVKMLTEQKKVAASRLAMNVNDFLLIPYDDSNIYLMENETLLIGAKESTIIKELIINNNKIAGDKEVISIPKSFLKTGKNKVFYKIVVKDRNPIEIKGFIDFNLVESLPSEMSEVNNLVKEILNKRYENENDKYLLLALIYSHYSNISDKVDLDYNIEKSIYLYKILNKEN